MSGSADDAFTSRRPITKPAAPQSELKFIPSWEKREVEVTVTGEENWRLKWRDKSVPKPAPVTPSKVGPAYASDAPKKSWTDKSAGPTSGPLYVAPVASEWETKVAPASATLPAAKSPAGSKVIQADAWVEPAQIRFKNSETKSDPNVKPAAAWDPFDPFNAGKPSRVVRAELQSEVPTEVPAKVPNEVAPATAVVTAAPPLPIDDVAPGRLMPLKSLRSAEPRPFPGTLAQVQPDDLDLPPLPVKPNKPAKPAPPPPATEPADDFFSEPKREPAPPVVPPEAPTPKVPAQPRTRPQPPPAEDVPDDRPPMPAPTPVPPPSPLGKVNGRDCGADARACQKTIEELRQSTISSLSIDIAPPFRTPDQVKEGMGAEFPSDAPATQWTNREGQVVAEGKLVGLRSQRAVIEQANGSKVEIPLGTLSAASQCYLSAYWNIPSECRLLDDNYPFRNWTPLTMTWTASQLCHKPLYFEEVQLERYGHAFPPGIGPVVSGAHFFLNIAALPYNAGMDPPWECKYALGYYRPGSCAPWLWPAIPLSVRGGLAEAGVITGGVFLLP